MAGIFDSEVGKKASIGTKLDVQTCFSFQITHKAIARDQAIQMGLDVPEKYTVWPVEFCNTEVDRHNERFTKGVLDVFASQMVARSFTFNLFHRSDKGIGKTLKKASVEPNGTGYILKGYIAISDKASLPDQAILVNDAITEGIYTDVSVEISGSTEYVSDGQGNRGVWEYYVDAERPNRTQFMGAALVAIGAQIGATIVKSIDGSTNPEKENNHNKNMQQFNDVDIVCGKKMVFKSVEKNGSIFIEGHEELKAEANAQYKAATEAVIAKDAAIAEKAASEAETAVFKAAIVTELTGLQLALKMTTPKTVAELEAMKAPDLIAMRQELHKQFESTAPKTEQVNKAAINDAEKSVAALTY